MHLLGKWKEGCIVFLKERKDAEFGLIVRSVHYSGPIILNDEGPHGPTYSRS